MAKENATTRVAVQIRLLREQAGLTQAQLAHAIGTKQGSIARLENMTYGKFSMSMLQKIADYFDVVAWVEFAPFSSLLRRTTNLSPKALTPASYSEEFDSEGQPLLELDLRFDGSSICRSNYIASASVPSNAWSKFLDSTSTPLSYRK